MELERQVVASGFAVRSMSLEMLGTCADCQEGTD